jgi:hypothetical protein
MENKIEFKEILLKDLDKKLECLDNFCEFYGWSIYKYDYNSYLIKDNQTNELEYFGWFSALLERISSRALDYEINEHEMEDSKLTIGGFHYLTDLLWVYMANGNLEDKYQKEWFMNIIKDMGKIEIEKEN